MADVCVGGEHDARPSFEAPLGEDLLLQGVPGRRQGRLSGRRVHHKQQPVHALKVLVPEGTHGVRTCNGEKLLLAMRPLALALNGYYRGPWTDYSPIQKLQQFRPQ